MFLLIWTSKCDLPQRVFFSMISESHCQLLTWTSTAVAESLEHVSCPSEGTLSWLCEMPLTPAQVDMSSTCSQSAHICSGKSGLAWQWLNKWHSRHSTNLYLASISFSQNPIAVIMDYKLGCNALLDNISKSINKHSSDLHYMLGMVLDIWDEQMENSCFRPWGPYKLQLGVKHIYMKWIHIMTWWFSYSLLLGQPCLLVKWLVFLLLYKMSCWAPWGPKSFSCKNFMILSDSRVT